MDKAVSREGSVKCEVKANAISPSDGVLVLAPSKEHLQCLHADAKQKYVCTTRAQSNSFYFRYTWYIPPKAKH